MWQWRGYLGMIRGIICFNYVTFIIWIQRNRGFDIFLNYLILIASPSRWIIDGFSHRSTPRHSIIIIILNIDNKISSSLRTHLTRTCTSRITSPPPWSPPPSSSRLRISRATSAGTFRQTFRSLFTGQQKLKDSKGMHSLFKFNYLKESLT